MILIIAYISIDDISIDYKKKCEYWKNGIEECNFDQVKQCIKFSAIKHIEFWLVEFSDEKKEKKISHLRLEFAARNF